MFLFICCLWRFIVFFFLCGMFAKQVYIIIRGQMFDSPRLTRNGVLYLSLGFTQEYLLQVLALTKHQTDLHLVLYDGLAYIGALHSHSNTRPVIADPQHPQQIAEGRGVKELDVVRVVPMLARPNEPVVIQRMEVVQSGLGCLLGQQAITLSELMRRREFRRRPAMVEEREEEELSPHSRKIAKLFGEGSVEQQKQVEDQSKQAKNEQIGVQYSNPLKQGEVIVLDDLSAEQQQVLPQKYYEKMVIEEKIQSREPFIQQGSVSLQSINQQSLPPQKTAHSIDKKQDKQERISSTNSSLEIITKPKQEKPLPINKSNIIDADCIITTSLPLPTKPPKTIPTQSSQKISDLYERMHRFRLLCRVNSMSYFTSQRGTFCTKLHLIDEMGDEITCMMFQKTPPNDPDNKKLGKGKTYIFQDGEVNKEEDGALSITVPLTGIIDYNKFMPSFVPAKMLRLGDIGRQQSSDYYMEKAINLEKIVQSRRQQTVNICGIFQGFKEQPKPAKSNFRVVGILCDPDHQLSIHFCLIVDDLVTFPSEGSVFSLHNIVVLHDDRTLQLQGGKNSYILNEIGNTHEYFSDLLKSSHSGQWRMQDYKNLSLITYTPRSILQLKKLLSGGTEDDLAYSQIDCRIANIKERRSYQACVVCKREVRADSAIFTTCFSCKKLNKHTTRFMFDIELSDPTGCLIADLSSDRLEEFIGMGVTDYAGYNREQRAMYMDLCAYKEIVVRLKSERMVGGVIHRAISAGKTNHKRSLTQIRAMAIEEKTKYIGSW